MSRFSTNGIVIVGAGPYGLSVAAHLRRHGLPFRIFGSPMQSWRSNMPAGMFLKSEGRASSLSDPAGSYTPKAPVSSTA
jgi:FAD-dependent urate hydroxylase